MVLYTWEFTIRDETAYVPVNHGFAAHEDNEEYDRDMKTCFFFYGFWGEYLAAKRIVDSIPVAADRAREKQRLQRAVEVHFTNNLAFLPCKRRTFKSISDLQSVPARRMRALKATEGLAETEWDGGYSTWITHHRDRIAQWQ